MKSKRTIQRHLNGLRKLMESPDTDLITARIAYAMSMAVIWATEDVSWPGLVDEAIANGIIAKVDEAIANGIIAKKGEPK